MSHPGFAVVLDRCLGVRAGEQVLLIVDDGTDAEVVARLQEGVERRGAVLQLVKIPTPSLPGEEPPLTAAADLLAADAAIELTSLFIGSRRRGRKQLVQESVISRCRESCSTRSAPMARSTSTSTGSGPRAAGW